MSEKKQFRNALITLGLVLIFAVLYSLGGMEGYGKVLRRYIAPSVLIGGIFAIRRDWRVLVQLPFMVAGLSMGYGADELWGKIFRRGLYGIANGAGFSIYNLLSKRFIYSIFTTVLITGVSIYIGVYNPLADARTEELFLGLVMASTFAFSVRSKE